MSFADKLAYGKVAEGLIAKWLMSRGHSVLPVYELEKSAGKGPQFFTQWNEYCAPDMVCFTSNGAIWIEAKHKTVFSWHRNTSQWTTGIDLRHYESYKAVEVTSRMAVWLMFFHRHGTPWESDIKNGCPEECPTGLFGEKLAKLQNSEHHRTTPYNRSAEVVGHGKSGMVYWADTSLRLLASHDDVVRVTTDGQPA